LKENNFLYPHVTLANPEVLAKKWETLENQEENSAGETVQSDEEEDKEGEDKEQEEDNIALKITTELTGLPQTTCLQYDEPMEVLRECSVVSRPVIPIRPG
jgi:hypothetical protein